MTSLHFEVLGTVRPDVPTLMLSSGLGGAAGYWQPQLDALRERGWTVIVYDHRGTGRSPDTLPDAYTIDAMAQDVADILDAAGVERCHFVGHALGALAGLQLARQAPQRVASLTLINAWATMHAATHRCFDARLSLLAHAGVSAYVNAQPIFLYPSAWIDTHAARVAAEVDHAIRAFAPVPNLLARIHALRAFDLRGDFSEITAPTLVVAADDDVLVPCHASQALARGLPDARLFVMPYGGHACNVTCPESFNHALIDFIASMSSDAPASLVSHEEA